MARRPLALESKAIAMMKDRASLLLSHLLPGLKVAVGPSHYYIIQSVKSVNLNTFWMAYDGEVFGSPNNWPALVAAFGQRNGAIKKNIEWRPPEYMKLWFATKYNLSGGYQSSWIFASMDGELYRPPLPNVYGGGEICMGSHFTPTSEDSAYIHQEAYDDFIEASFNSDLIEGQTKYLLINAEDEPIHPTMGTYKEALGLISSEHLKFMGEVISGE